MIVTTPAEFRQALKDRPLEAHGPATMKAAFLVSPSGFHVEEESARDNRYMTLGDADANRALLQHDALAQALMHCGLPVITMPGRADLPDGVFPNNTFATASVAGAGGRFIVGAMRHEVRRGEAQREDVRRLFTEFMGYELHDLSSRDLVAELTGPLIIHRSRGIGFCGMTERVDEAGCEAMHEAFGLELTFRFDLDPGEYHTNVVMAVLADRGVVLHAGSFADPDVPEAIAEAFDGRALFLDDGEKAGFAGNCIAVTPNDVFMSQRGVEALRKESRNTLESWGFTLHGIRLDELEKAGGSLRCCVAEIF